MPRPRRTRRSKDTLWDDPKTLAVVAVAFVFLFSNWIIRTIIIVAGFAVLGAYLAMYRRKVAQWQKLGMETIDTMTGEDFEERLLVLFRDLGYSVAPTVRKGDWGADLILTKNGVRTVVQAKRYAKPVSLPAVQEAFTAKSRYGCTKALDVTNTTFTKGAAELASDNGVELWDRERLIRELKRVTK